MPWTCDEWACSWTEEKDMNRRILAGAVVAASLSMTGCWESADVTMHEPGKYKGKSDPLLAQQGASRSEALKKRFQLVQMDR